jgi:hypothetical protein
MGRDGASRIVSGYRMTTLTDRLPSRKTGWKQCLTVVLSATLEAEMGES